MGSQQSRTLINDGWTMWNYDHDKIECDFSTPVNSITKMNIQICKAKNSGTSEEVLLRLKNDVGEDCKNFKVTAATKIWVSNAEGKDDFCLSYLSLDTVGPNGHTKMIQCTYAADEHYNLVVLGEET